MRRFESQARYVRPLPPGFKWTEKEEIPMEVDEVNGKKLRVLTFNDYFAYLK